MALAATLSHAQARLAGTNDVTLQGTVETLRPDHRLCQPGERVAAGTAALALTATRAGRPRPTLTVALADAATGAPIAAGSAAWSGETATARLRPPLARERAVRVCLMLRGGGAGARTTLFGGPAGDAPSATDDGERLGGRVRFDYARAGTESWWSLAPTVAGRIGRRGHAWPGSPGRAARRAPDPGLDRGRLVAARAHALNGRAAAWLFCALVALLNAVACSLLTPAFQVPDEQSHYAYTEYLAEHGRPPTPSQSTATPAHRPPR